MKRVLTAIVFVAVMVGGIYLHPITHLMLFISIAALALWEYFGLTLPSSNTTRKWGGLLLGLLPFFLVIAVKNIVGQSFGLTPIQAFLIFLLGIFSVFIYELFSGAQKPYTNIGLLLLGVLYIGISLALIPIISFQDDTFRPNIILGILLLTWANDTGAYLVGSQLGRNKLFPRISPKKTWEGSLGGLCITFLIAYLLSIFFKDLKLFDWLVLAGIVSLFGTLGDLVESMLKRSLGIKDSGNLLPGHGGILDRFDAFIFLVPFTATYLLWNS